MRYTTNHSNYRKSYFLLLALLLLAVPAAAQSTDRDNPTMLTSNEIKDEGVGKSIEYYYGFTAGPGEVTITVDLKAKSYSTAVRFELLDAESNQILAHNMNAATTTGAERVVKKARVREKQSVVLKLVLDSNTGEYMVRLGGAVEFASTEAAPTETTSPTESTTQTTDSSTASGDHPATEADASASAGEPAQSGIKQQAKEKGKAVAKKAATKLLDKFPF
jgi:hypothetical protein